MTLEEELYGIATSSASQSEKIESYKGIISTLRGKEDLQVFLSFLLTAQPSSGGLVFTRPVFVTYIEHIANLNTDLRDKEELLSQTLAELQPSLVLYEEQESLIRESLATVCETLGEHGKAATVLRGIKLESGQRVISDEYRVEIYVRILRNLLENIDIPTGESTRVAEDDVEADDENEKQMIRDQCVLQAEEIINKAAAIVLKSKSPIAKVHFKLAQARVFEARKRFLEACAKYYDLSINRDESSGIDSEDKLICLSAAVSCALLSPAGPARSRMLGSLHKDDRIREELPAEYAVLERLFYDNLLTSEDINQFVEGSKRRISRAHMKQGPSQESVLDRAVREHNLLAASKLYANISFVELAGLLGLDKVLRAETYAARMIQERRLRAVIDRVDQIIYFVSEGPTEAIGSHEISVMRLKQRQRDNEVMGICLALEDVVTIVQKEYSQFVLEA
ncbi:hypothetical protein V1511DRAFT_503636 [Dipodascopsis uninucleata]